MPRAVATGVVLACIAYTHVFGYMVPPVFFASVLLLPRLRKRLGRHAVIAGVVTFVLFLPWLFVIPAQIHKVSSASASGGWWMPVPDNLGNYLIANLTSFSPGRSCCLRQCS